MVVVAAVAFYIWSLQPPSARAPMPTTERPVQMTREHGIEPPPPAVSLMVADPPIMAAPQVRIPAPQRLAPEMVIPIQDGATIDYSIGAPVVRSGGKDTEALDRALREMEEATRTMTFPPAQTDALPPRKP